MSRQGEARQRGKFPMRSALRGFYRFIGAALARIIPHDSRINHRHLSISDLASSPHRHQNAECRVMLRRRSINCLAETRDSHHVIQPSITPVSKENQRKRISTSICIDTCYFSNLILSPPPSISCSSWCRSIVSRPRLNKIKMPSRIHSTRHSTLKYYSFLPLLLHLPLLGHIQETSNKRKQNREAQTEAQSSI